MSTGSEFAVDEGAAEVAAPLWRRGSWWLVSLVVVIALVGGVGAWLSDNSRNPIGDALAPWGLAADGVIGLDAPAAGQVYYLGLTPFANRSSQPVTVVGYRVLSLSSNVQVLGYRAYSTDQFDGAMISMYDPSHPDPSIDFIGARPLHLPYVIPAHSSSNRFAMAKVRLLAYPPPGYAKDCLVRYRLGSSTAEFLERFNCSFYFGERAEDYYDGKTSLQVVNSYPRRVQLLGCPVCGAHGIVLPGSPHAHVGEGGSFGWDLSTDDPRAVTAVVNGRTVHCHPPPTNGTWLARFGPDLYYDITPSGHCITIR